MSSSEAEEEEDEKQHIASLWLRHRKCLGLVFAGQKAIRNEEIAAAAAAMAILSSDGRLSVWIDNSQGFENT